MSATTAAGRKATGREQGTAVARPRAAGILYTAVFPALGVVSLLVSCVVWSIKKQLWADEIFTRTEIGDPSFRHLLQAVPQLGGGGMPLFYLTAWPWAHLFGLSDLSLRLYSSVCLCAAFLALLAILRRRFEPSSAFLGAGFALFACLIFVDQNDEARGYGLYLLLAVLAVGQWLRVAEEENPSGRNLALLALSQAGLVLGHVLGLIYAGLMLAALLLSDRTRRWFRLRVYLCLMAGWLALIPWIPAIRASMAVGKPHGWITMPTVGDLATGLSFWLFAGIYFPIFRNVPAGLVFGWVVAICCVVFLVLEAVAALRTETPARRPLYLLALMLLAAPLAFFAVSHVAQPIYVARYMLPSILGVALLSVGWARQSWIRTRWQRLTLATLVLCLPLAAALLAQPIHLDVDRIDALTGGQPVVCDWLRDFMVMMRYSSHPSALEYPLDWEAAVHGPAAGPGGYHLMENYRRVGYWKANLRDGSEVLGQKSFFVLDESDTNWFALEIQHNPRYRWKVVARIDKDHVLYAVRQP